MKRILLLLSVLALPFWSSAQTISAENVTLHVPGDYSTIQAAVDAANDGDTVLVADGTYYENIRIYSKSFVLASHFILDGNEEHITNTILDGSKPALADSASVILLRSCPVSGPLIKGFTLTGGGGTKALSPTGFMRHGGGICAIYSGVTIEKNIITGNEVSDDELYTGGGGIFAVNNLSSMQVTIRDNTIHDNHIQSPTYTQGGGIFLAEPDGLKLVEKNDIYENTATCTSNWKANGGGIMLVTWEPWSTPIILRNNRIAKNEIHCEASHGGGIFLTINGGGNINEWKGKSGIEIYNNLIVDNFSEERGGGISVWDQNDKTASIEDPNPLIFNNTIVNNKAREGGALYNFGMNVLLFNNIMWNDAEEGNTCEISMEDTENPGHAYSHNGIVQCMYNDIKGGFAGTGNINKEPFWIDATYEPDSMNRCIGRGTKSLKIGMHTYRAPTTDYYGNPRPNSVDEFVDLGAIESSYPVGILSNSTYESFRLYPNPAEDHVVLLADQYRRYTLELYASSGQLVKQNEFIGSSCSLDLSAYEKGMYMLVLRSQGKVWTNRLIKQ